MDLLFVVATGSRSGDDVINVSAEAKAGSDVDIRVNAGDGNNHITTLSNGWTSIVAGNGNNTIAATSTGLGSTRVQVGSGDNTITLTNGGQVKAGSGYNVINLHSEKTQDVVKNFPAIGVGGSGTTVINADGDASWADGGSGTTTINNISRAGLGTGTTILNMSNSNSSQVYIRAGHGNAVINLSDPSAGIGDNWKAFTTNQGNGTYPDSKVFIPIVSADSEGNFNGDGRTYQDVLPTTGQAGFGLAHTILDFHSVSQGQVTSALNGSTLTLTQKDTGSVITINNYQAGRLTFSYQDDYIGGKENLIATRQPPNLQSAAPSASPAL